MLSVEAAALVELLITANDLFRTYGDDNPPFTAEYDGFVNGDTEAVVSGLEVSTAAVPASPVGNYTITPFGASADGYNINYDTGVLDLRDLFYYCSLVGVFLTLNLYRLEHLRWAGNPLRPRHWRWLAVCGLMIANLLVANVWLHHVRGIRVDLTEGQVF